MSDLSNATPPADVSAKPPRRFRRLRIAVSVFFGVLAVALCVLWLIGYFGQATFAMVLPPLPSGHNQLFVASGAGSISMHLLIIDPASQRMVASYGFARRKTITQNALLKFLFIQHWNREYTVIFPIWVPLLICASLASVCSGRPRRRQFSLRTMLVATTLMAVVLGLVRYALR